MPKVDVELADGGPLGEGQASYRGTKVSIKMTKWIIRGGAKAPLVKAGKKCVTVEGRTRTPFTLKSADEQSIEGDLEAPVQMMGTHREA